MEILDLIDKRNFEEVLSLCYGKIFSNQMKLQKYLGDYERWDVDLDNGKLFIDDKEFDVEFLGTTSNEDGMWFDADLEKIDDKYLQILHKSKQKAQENEIEELLNKKIKLNEIYTGHNIAAVYTFLSKENVCYFKGGEDVSLYMVIKDLPSSIYEPVNWNEFFDTLFELRSWYGSQKKLIKGFAFCNGNEIKEDGEKILIKFNKGKNIECTFDGDMLLKALSK